MTTLERKEKYKILMISDHALSTSGVATQSRHLIEGLIAKGCWTFRQFGAALKHSDHRVIKANDDLIIRPIEGFGNPDLIRTTLATERPDALFLFTDPRFFMYIWEMEDEIHQICPIVYWHVWDNKPTPVFNDPLHAATDLINCHSHLTYEMVAERFPEKTNFVPHSIPEQICFPLPDRERRSWKAKLLGNDRADHFVALWVNRNAKRKRPNDVIWAWSKFLERLQVEEGHQRATLIMHTDPNDHEGPNLIQTADMLGIKDSIFFSPDRLDFAQMNVLHNVSDVCLNISFAEGFGLTTLESMMCGNPIIAIKTGGLTRQVVDHRDGTENGIALDVEMRSLVGSQNVPYIYEDYVSVDTVADALSRLHAMGFEKRRELGQKARDYALSEFSHQKTIDTWHETLLDTVKNWRSRYRRVESISM